MSDFTFTHQRLEQRKFGSEELVPGGDRVVVESDGVTLDELYETFENFLRAVGFQVEADYDKECPRCGRGEEEEEEEELEPKVEQDGWITGYSKKQYVAGKPYGG